VFAASIALVLGTGCSDDVTYIPDAGSGTTDAGGGGGTGGETGSDAGGNPSLDVSVGDDTGSGGGGTDTGGGGGGGGAALDCVGIIECINSSDGTQAGLEACIDEGTPEAQGQITDVLICLQENCGDAESDAEFASCQQEFCSAELQACNGQAAPEGDAGCAETVECLLGCGQNEACAGACVANADSQETLNQVSAYVTCASESCTSATSIDEFYACAEENCPEEFAACQ
jgi:hypothetical protein